MWSRLVAWFKGLAFLPKAHAEYEFVRTDSIRDLEKQDLFSNYGTIRLIHNDSVRDAMTYNTQDLALWSSLMYVAFTVWNRKSLWMTALQLWVLSLVVGIVVLATVRDPAQLDVSRFGEISGFLRTFVGLLLGFFMSASVNRWWKTVESFTALCQVVRKLQMMLIACDVPKKEREQVLRYGFLSARILHMELHIQALPLDDQEIAFEKRWGAFRNGEDFQATQTFKPNACKMLGVECDADGKVTRVLDDGQAKDKHIKVGHRIVKVGVAAWDNASSTQELERVGHGNSDYQLTFKVGFDTDIAKVLPEEADMLQKVQATYTFKPNGLKMLGVECDADGTVTTVLDDGQAKDKDIKVGNRIVKVGAAAWENASSKQDLERVKHGNSDYQLTFEVGVSDAPGTLWIWIGALLGQLADENLIRTLAAPSFARCMSLAGEGLDRIIQVRSSITAQAPYIYVQMLSSLVHINNIVSALSFGMTTGVSLGTWLEYCGVPLYSKMATSGEAAVDAQAFVVAFFSSCFGPFVYQALLEVSIAIAQPFSNDDAKVPTRRIMLHLEEDLLAGMDTATAIRGSQRSLSHDHKTCGEDSIDEREESVEDGEDDD